MIKNEDWVLTANNLKQQVRKLWDFDKPYRHPGVELGTSTQIGISLGVALAHKGTGRIVVDIQPDGDLMFDAGALWVAAKYQIPMLVVMHNNRAYYNDWEHQIRMAQLRGTDEAKAHIGMDLFGPEPDFAALARSMGCWGEGPIDKPQDVRPRARARARRGEEGQAGAGGHDHAAPVSAIVADGQALGASEIRGARCPQRVLHRKLTRLHAERLEHRQRGLGGEEFHQRLGELLLPGGRRQSGRIDEHRLQLLRQRPDEIDAGKRQQLVDLLHADLGLPFRHGCPRARRARAERASA